MATKTVTETARPRTSRTPRTAPAARTTGTTKRLPPLGWQRWALLACAIFNALFFLTTALAPHLTYYVSTRRPAPTPLAIQLLVTLTYWGALLCSTVMELCIVLGLLRRRYHAMLYIIAACSVSTTLFLGGIELLFSLHIGYGFSEPLTWLLIGALEVCIAFGSLRSAPPETVRPAVIASQFLLRLHAASSAFSRAWRLVEAVPGDEGE